MSAPRTVPATGDRFGSLTPAALSSGEKSAVVALALQILSQRCRRGRAFGNPADVEAFLRLKLTGRRNEVFGAVFLDTRNRYIDIAELFRGTIDGAAVYPRVVLQQALDRNAAAVVLFHQHPSGVAEPSESDRAITERLSQALALVDVRVLDHLVVTDGEVVSMARRGWV